jgi:predicted N-formylglutamate amidohydrolase
MPSPAPSLLADADPAPVEVLDGEGSVPALLTCDHAGNAVPAALNGLGLAPGLIERHIGWDIGAASVTRLLSQQLGAPAILTAYSRLVIDCNRDPADPSSIPEMSDGTVVPGNRGLSPAARARRQRFHAAGSAPALLSIHSFTPVMNGTARPWHVGILWDADPRLPVPLLAALRADPSLVVGDNEPYSAREPAGYTVRHHAASEGLPHVAIELRQDLIADASGAAAWAARLAAALAPLLATPGLYRRERR